MLWHNMEEIWSELIAAVLGAVLGWFSRHYKGGK